MLRKIDRVGDNEIWKSSGIDGKTGAEVINFYGVRPVGAKEKPFNSQHDTLRDARESLETA